MTDLYRIVHLYRQFPKYDIFTYEQLVKNITPSLMLDQYQIHTLNGKDVGYTNWAFLNETVEARYKLTGKLKANEWNCGENIWVIGVIAKSNTLQIMKWVKEFFKPKLKINQCVKWIRKNDDLSIYRISQKYKRPFHQHI